MCTMGGMRHTLFALLLLGCPGPSDTDAGSDAAVYVDASEQTGCTEADVPRIGVDPFCPSVDDFVRAVNAGEVDAASLNDAGLYCPDAGSEDAGCTRYARNVEIILGCDRWTYCAAVFGGCFNCAEWSPYPGAL